MAKNSVQFQKGYSLPELMAEYGTEEQCREALARWRWPHGFVCPGCGHNQCFALRARELYQCRGCRQQTSLTAGTLLEHTKLPLRTWFIAMHLLTQAKNGISALELSRQLGVSYNTAWKLKHKLMQAMKERDDRRALRGLVQLDDAYWGGERRGGKRGRGAPGKVPFVAALETSEDGRPLAMRLSRVEGFRHAELRRWAGAHLEAGTTVVSDGLSCFGAVAEAGCTHRPITTGGGPSSVERAELQWVNTMLGNLKRSIHGTYHAIRSKHLPRYLAEFCFRFNRRFNLRAMLSRLASIAMRTPPIPYRLLKLAEQHW